MHSQSFMTTGTRGLSHFMPMAHCSERASGMGSAHIHAARWAGTSVIFEKTYERFLGACQDMRWHRARIAKPVVHDLLASRIDDGLPNEALLSHLIAEALLRRIDEGLLASKNIYLQRHDLSQIDLFYAMRRTYPHVPASHAVANQILASALREEREAMLLDIGTGKGLQLADLLRLLADDPGRLERLDLVALDPDARNLDAAETAFNRLRPALGYALAVHRVEKLFEDTNADDERALLAIGGDALYVNAAYALHHTTHPLHDVDARTVLLRRVARLSPRLFTLVEPSANHDTEDLATRLHSCWEHFGTVFDLVDWSDAPPSHKFVVKQTFFGREINDIFGVGDAFRCERHEPYESWLLRAAKVGLSPRPLGRLTVNLPSYCDLAISDGLIRLGYRGVPLIAVFAYETDPAYPRSGRWSGPPPSSARAHGKPPSWRRPR